MTNYYVYDSKHGPIRTLKADMDDLRSRTSTWEANNHLPTPPTIKTTPDLLTWEQMVQASKMAKSKGITRKNAQLIVAEEIGDVANEDDEKYQADLILWQANKWRFSEHVLFFNYTLVPVEGATDEDGAIDGHMTVRQISEGNLWERADLSTISKVRSGPIDEEEAGASDILGLYIHITRTSQLTYEAVLEAARKFWYTSPRETYSRMHTQGRGRLSRFNWPWLFSRLRGIYTSARVSVYGNRRSGKAASNMAMQELAVIL